MLRKTLTRKKGHHRFKVVNEKKRGAERRGVLVASRGFVMRSRARAGDRRKKKEIIPGIFPVEF